MTEVSTAAPGKHVLVVDDDHVFGETLCRLLRANGYRTQRATDFRSALEILEAEQPLDLLVADIVMPDSVNGIALARMARLRRRDLKVIYLTGYDIPGAEREALGPILRKPISDRELLEAVSQALAG